MLAAGGTVMVSGLRDRRRGSFRGRIDGAPSERVAIEHPHPPRLLYSLPVFPFAPEEIDPLSNSNGRMSRSRPRHFAILSLAQARHALIIYLSVAFPLLLQWQRNDMNLIARQLPILALSAKDVSSAREDGKGVVGAREKGGAGDAFECRAERLGGLSEAIGSDGAAFDGGGDDLLGCHEARHCCWVHVGWRSSWLKDERMPRWRLFAKGYYPFNLYSRSFLLPRYQESSTLSCFEISSLTVYYTTLRLQ